MSQYRIYVHQKGRQKGSRERGIYVDSKGALYRRLIGEDGRDSYVPYGTKSVTQAIKIRDARIEAKALARHGVDVVDPDKAAKTAIVTVPKVIKRYEADGYPDKKGRPRKPGRHLEAEKGYCKTLLNFFNGDAAAADLDQSVLDDYYTWRVELVKNSGKINKDGTAAKARGEGKRTVDLELNCLNNAMRWAVRKRLIRSNPIAEHSRYHSSSDAKHCREFSLESPEELHRVAGALMSSRRSEVLGWQLLIEATSGLRTEETVLLRMDARSDEPGGLTPDGGTLCVNRAKKSTKYNPHVQVNDGLKQVLEAHRAWHAKRYPKSPWYLPGRDKEALKHVSKSALTKALDRLYDQGTLKRKYTSHGAGRAFYVYVRRSQGADDPQICYEINHTGGVGTLESVYGLPAKHWRDGKAPNLAWIPTGAPAWTRIEYEEKQKAKPDKPEPVGKAVETEAAAPGTSSNER